ncbi:MAG: ABC transporter permease [Desulfomonile tiedjei]|uniref:ABC transporter permease n=1 Tax=Desulfomonile tiedjei TaxID=2358 RepID=A0A9D6V7L6_9BACT|nr:ABC transporter permease [Desulfomonile tiedjei]
MKQAAYKIALPLLFLALWYSISRFGHISPLILPDPESTVRALISLIQSGDLALNTYVSLKRSMGGFLLGSFLGVASGILIGWSHFWEDFFDLAINFVRAIPKTALAPLFIVWFGLGDSAKILLIAFSSYFFTVIPTIEGVKNVDSLYVKTARSMGANEFQIMTSVIMPAAMPAIFAGLRLTVTTALIVLVMVEIVAGNDGLGYLLQEARGNLDMAIMFATLFALGVLGYCLDAAMQYLGKKLMPWRKGKTLSM